jgi:hypothetical protein
MLFPSSGDSLPRTCKAMEQIISSLFEVDPGQLIQRLTIKADSLTHMTKPRLALENFRRDAEMGAQADQGAREQRQGIRIAWGGSPGDCRIKQRVAVVRQCGTCCSWMIRWINLIDTYDCLPL